VVGEQALRLRRELVEGLPLLRQQMLVILRGAADSLARVVDDDVQAVELGLEKGAELLDGYEVTEVDAVDVQAARPGREI